MLQLKYFHEQILPNQKLLSFFIRLLFLPRFVVRKDDRSETYKSTTIAMTELALETKKITAGEFLCNRTFSERTNERTDLCDDPRSTEVSVRFSVTKPRFG